jgi:hypothetical protein
MPGTPTLPAKYRCSACEREVDYVRGSIWHGDHQICRDCFYMWYDPDYADVDQTSSLSVGNAVRRKHGLAPL